MDLAGALVIDEKVNLAVELASLVGLQFVDELASSGWQRYEVGKVGMGGLRTEAAIQISAETYADHPDWPAGLVVQAEKKFAFLSWGTVRNLDVGFGN